MKHFRVTSRCVMLSLASLLPVCLLFSSCRTSRGVSIARGARMELLAPKLLGRALSATQIFTSVIQKKRRTLYVQLEVDHSRIVMVGLTPVGTKLFELFYERERLRYIPQPFFKARLKPAHILADLQLTFWPLDVLKSPLLRAGLKISEHVTKGRRERLILRGSTPIIRIRYEHPKEAWRGKLYFHHIERGYRFTIQTVQIRRIPIFNYNPSM